MACAQRLTCAFTLVCYISSFIAPTAGIRSNLQDSAHSTNGKKRAPQSSEGACSSGKYFDPIMYSEEDQDSENPGKYLESTKDDQCYDVCECVEGTGGDLSVFFKPGDLPAAKAIIAQYCPTDALELHAPQTKEILGAIKMITMLHEPSSPVFQVMERLLDSSEIASILEELKVLNPELVAALGHSKVMYQANNGKVASIANILGMPLLAATMGLFGKDVEDDMKAMEGRNVHLGRESLAIVFDFSCSVGTANVLVQQVESMIGELPMPSASDVLALLQEMVQSVGQLVQHDRISRRFDEQVRTLLEARDGSLPPQLEYNQLAGSGLPFDEVLSHDDLYRNGLYNMCFSQAPYHRMLQRLTTRSPM